MDNSGRRQSRRKGQRIHKSNVAFSARVSASVRADQQDAAVPVLQERCTDGFHSHL